MESFSKLMWKKDFHSITTAQIAKNASVTAYKNNIFHIEQNDSKAYIFNITYPAKNNCSE